MLSGAGRFLAICLVEAEGWESVSLSSLLESSRLIDLPAELSCLIKRSCNDLLVPVCDIFLTLQASFRSGTERERILVLDRRDSSSWGAESIAQRKPPAACTTLVCAGFHKRFKYTL